MVSRFVKFVGAICLCAGVVALVTFPGCTSTRTLNARIRSGMPDWAKGNTVERSGQYLKVVCSGQGPSIDHARKYALSNCKSSAADFLTSDMSVRGVTVESDTGVAVHQEILQKTHYRGLSCKPARDEVSPLEDGLFEVWLKCDFDLAKINQTSEPEEGGGVENSPAPESPPSRENLVKQRELQFDGQKMSGSIDSVTTVLDVVSIPPCESVVVQGRTARPVKCSNTGITSVAINPGDEQIIVRARGYISKTIKVVPGALRHETVQVILDPAN